MSSDISDGAVACLLITGTAGVGKGAIAKEVGELMRLDSTGCAVIDLDAISKCTTDPPVPGFFESAIMIENLTAIWPNYVRYGVTRVVLARAVASKNELDLLQAAIPASQWTVCLVTAPDALSLIASTFERPASRSRFCCGSPPASQPNSKSRTSTTSKSRTAPAEASPR